MVNSAVTQRRLRLAFGIASTISFSGCAFLPNSATEQAQSARSVWEVFSYAGIAVGAFVWLLIFWCVIRYRKKPNDDGTYPKQFRRSRKLEAAYTILPFLMVVALFAYMYASERSIETLSRHPDVIVDVTGFQWSWRFDYPQLHVTQSGTTGSPPELVLPVGETTRMRVSSSDVDHSFWIPAFLFKRDAIPGLRNEFDFKPTTIGTFRGECGEFCGMQHATMAFNVRTVSPQEFARWAQSRRPAANRIENGVAR